MPATLRVLGRVIRLSQEDETGPHVPLRLTWHGKDVNGAHVLMPLGQGSFRSQREREAMQDATAAIGKAMAHGKRVTMRGDYRIVVADPDGAVSHVPSGNPWAHISPIEEEGASDRHDDAAKSGNILVQAHWHPSMHLKHLVGAAFNEFSKPRRERDDAPFLILADHLDEEGFPEHAEYLRRAHHPLSDRRWPSWNTVGPNEFLNFLSQPVYQMPPDPRAPRQFSLISPTRVLGRVTHLSLDRLPGGKADRLPPSAFAPSSLAQGKAVEREHTSNPDLAEEIARDHLAERPDYYDLLQQLEKKPLRILGRVVRFVINDDDGPRDKRPPHPLDVTEELDKRRADDSRRPFEPLPDVDTPQAIRDAAKKVLAEEYNTIDMWGDPHKREQLERWVDTIPGVAQFLTEAPRSYLPFDRQLLDLFNEMADYPHLRLDKEALAKLQQFPKFHPHRRLDKEALAKLQQVPKFNRLAASATIDDLIKEHQDKAMAIKSLPLPESAWKKLHGLTSHKDAKTIRVTFDPKKTPYIPHGMYNRYTGEMVQFVHPETKKPYGIGTVVYHEPTEDGKHHVYIHPHYDHYSPEFGLKGNSVYIPGKYLNAYQAGYFGMGLPQQAGTKAELVDPMGLRLAGAMYYRLGKKDGEEGRHFGHSVPVFQPQDEEKKLELWKDSSRGRMLTNDIQQRLGRNLHRDVVHYHASQGRQQPEGVIVDSLLKDYYDKNSKNFDDENWKTTHQQIQPEIYDLVDKHFHHMEHTYDAALKYARDKGLVDNERDFLDDWVGPKADHLSKRYSIDRLRRAYREADRDPHFHLFDTAARKFEESPESLKKWHQDESMPYNRGEHPWRGHDLNPGMGAFAAAARAHIKDIRKLEEEMRAEMQQNQREPYHPPPKPEAKGPPPASGEPPVPAGLRKEEEEFGPIDPNADPFGGALKGPEVKGKITDPVPPPMDFSLGAKTARVLGRTIRLAAPAVLPQDEEPSYRPRHRPTDLSEQEWFAVRPYFPETMVYAHNRRTPVQVLLNAVLFRLENGLPLRQVVAVAPDLPPWGSIHSFEEKIKRQGMWPTLLSAMGRDHLLPNLEKMMRLRSVTPPPPGLQHIKLSLAGTARVLGRTIRLSQEDAPLTIEYHRKVHGLGPDTSLASIEYMDDRGSSQGAVDSRNRFISHLITWAKATNSHVAITKPFTQTRSAPGADGRSLTDISHPILFVADADGHVTAHPQDTVLGPDIAHLTTSLSSPALDLYPDVKESMQKAVAAHEDAKKAGNVYARAVYGSHGIHTKPVIDAFMKAEAQRIYPNLRDEDPETGDYLPVDDAPELIAADYVADHYGPQHEAKLRLMPAIRTAHSVKLQERAKERRRPTMYRPHGVQDLAEHEDVSGSPQTIVDQEIERPGRKYHHWRLSHGNKARILGRTIRMSNEDEPPIVTKVHGQFADDESEQAARGMSDREIRELNRYAPLAYANRLLYGHGPEAISVQYSRADSDVGGNPTHVLFTADKDGNIVAHADSGRLRQLWGVHPWDRMNSFQSISPTDRDWYRLNDHWDIMDDTTQHHQTVEKAHHDAVKNGRLYAKAHFQGGDALHPLLHAVAKAYQEREDMTSGKDGKWDAAPQLILADYLEDRGYPLAHHLRYHLHTPSSIFRMLHHNSLDSLEAHGDDILATIMRHAEEDAQAGHRRIQFGQGKPKRVLGRIIRMADNPPPEVSDPLIRIEHPGYVHLPPELEADRGKIGLSVVHPKDVVQPLLKRAVHQGLAVDYDILESEPSGDSPPNNHMVYFVADDSGNVSAHHLHRLIGDHRHIGGTEADEHQVMRASPKIAANEAEWAFQYPDPDHPWARRGKKVLDILKGAHDDALKSGKLFSKAHYAWLPNLTAGYNIKDLLREHLRQVERSNQLLPAPYEARHDLIVSDALEDAGYPRAAHGLRRYTRLMAPEEEQEKQSLEEAFASLRRRRTQPDLFDMLARHERTPTDEERKRLHEEELAAGDPPRENARWWRRLGTGWRLSQEGHDYGCVYMPVPPSLAAHLLAFGQQVPDEELYEEDGRETCMHVTVLYGLGTDIGTDQVRQKVCGCGPVHGCLGEIAIFPNDDCDVLIATVQSDDLRRLNASLAELPHECRHPTYVPHVTIAYLKKGYGAKYVGDTTFAGQAFCADRLVYSPPEGEDAFLTLLTEGPVMTEVKLVLGRRVRFAIDPDKTDPYEPQLAATKPPVHPLGYAEGDFIPPELEPTPEEPAPSFEEIFHPSSRLHELSKPHLHFSSDPVRATLPDGRIYYFKPLTGREIEPMTMHADMAATEILRHLGFKNVPPTHPVYDDKGTLRGTASPHVPGTSLAIRDTDDDLKTIRAKNKPQDVGNYLTAAWLINADDRHGNNHIVGHDRTIHPIDFGYSFYPHREGWSRQSTKVDSSGLTAPDELVGWGLHHDTLFGFRFVEKDHRLDPKFVQKIVKEGPELRRIFEKHMNSARRNGAPPWWVDGARQEFERRLGHLKDIASQHGGLLKRILGKALGKQMPRLRDLPETHRIPYGVNSYVTRWMHPTTPYEDDE